MKKKILFLWIGLMSSAISYSQLTNYDYVNVDEGVSYDNPNETNESIRIPLHTTAKISFFETLPFKATIPIELDVPVDIPLNETAMGEYLKKVAKGMRELTKP